MLTRYCNGSVDFFTPYLTMRCKTLCSTRIQSFEQPQRQSCQEPPGAYLSCLSDLKILLGNNAMVPEFQGRILSFQNIYNKSNALWRCRVEQNSMNLNGNISSLGMIDFENGQATGAYHALVKACSVSNGSFTFDLDDFEGWGVIGNVCSIHVWLFYRLLFYMGLGYNIKWVGRCLPPNKQSWRQLQLQH